MRQATDEAQNDDGSVGGHADGWDMTQVMVAGSPMSETEDPTLEGIFLHRDQVQHVHQPRLPRTLGYLPLQTGFVFTLRTADSVTHPLPHPDLLTLHAAIMRVCRAAGASEMVDQGWDSHEDQSSEYHTQDGRGQQELSFALRRFLEEDITQDPAI